MQKLEVLLSEYSESHQNSINKTIHKICVPPIEFSVLGMISCIPEFLGFNWIFLVIPLALAYYAQFRNWLVIIVSALMTFPYFIFKLLRYENELTVYITVFIVAWIGQFIGHYIEGKRPSFFKDVFFLLIGPLWVGESLLKKFNLSLVRK